MLDVCHMLKLIRNMLGMQNIFDGNDRIIKWEYIDHLFKLQEKGLRLGNKLKQEHVNWKKNIMKVCLAAQVISGSIADSLKYTVPKNTT